MTDLQTAAQQALEALETRGEHHPRVYEAITALRAALAEPQSTHSPECYRWHHECAVAEVERLRAALAQQAEPVAWMIYTLDGKSVCVTDNPADFTDTHRALPLFTAPPQRKPLTEEEMYIVEEEARKNFRLAQAGPRGQMITYWDSLTPWLIRAVERAHGIE